MNIILGISNRWCRVQMTCYVTYTVPPRENHPKEQWFYKQPFESKEAALFFYNTRKLDYPNLLVFPPDEIGFYVGGQSKEYTELVQTVGDPVFKSKLICHNGEHNAVSPSKLVVVHIFRCFVCNAVFFNINDYKKHVRSCKSNKFLCPVCDYVCYTRPILEKHMYEHNWWNYESDGRKSKIVV